MQPNATESSTVPRPTSSTVQWEQHLPDVAVGGTGSVPGRCRFCGEDAVRRNPMTSDDPTQKDYYQILGVLRSATPTEITAAYHSLARACHPDVGGDNPQYLAKFKLVSEAYAILSDDHKRRAYDRKWRGDFESRYSAASPSYHCDVPLTTTCQPTAECFHEIAKMPNDIEAEIPIAPEEAVHGGPCDITLRATELCGPCEGQGHFASSTCDVCLGTGVTKTTRRLQLTLPRGVQAGMVLRIHGHGRQLAKSTGDLLLRVRIQPCW